MLTGEWHVTLRSRKQVYIRVSAARCGRTALDVTASSLSEDEVFEVDEYIRNNILPPCTRLCTVSREDDPAKRNASARAFVDGAAEKN